MTQSAPHPGVEERNTLTRWLQPTRCRKKLCDKKTKIHFSDKAGPLACLDCLLLSHYHPMRDHWRHFVTFGLSIA